MAKKFREIFFENNTIHLRGKKISWQKNFMEKKFCGKNFFLETILFDKIRGKIFRGIKIFVTKFFLKSILFDKIRGKKFS